MAEEKKGACGCDSLCMQFAATSGRYNDRSAFSNNGAMDNANALSQSFQATAQNTLSQTPGTELASMLAQLAGVINARPVGAGGTAT